jgi:hypothetical protein
VHGVEAILFLVVLGTVVAAFAGRLRVPAPSLLVIAGLAVGLTDRELRRDLNAAENAELARLYDDGTISQATRQQLQHSLDLEATRLSEQR